MGLSISACLGLIGHDGREALGQIRSILGTFQQRSVGVSRDSEHLPCSCLMAHVPLIGHGDVGHDGSSLHAAPSQPRHSHVPSLLPGVRGKAAHMGLGSYRIKALCGNLSSVGHGSQGGHGLFLLSPL